MKQRFGWLVCVGVVCLAADARVAVAGPCPNGNCSGGETCATCPQDCGACVVCGDGACTAPGETCGTCAADCHSCGDGCCNAAVGETCSTCNVDCGACPPSCGDGTCNGTENCNTCVIDCGTCAQSCGDAACTGTETCTTCAADCGACPAAGAIVGIPDELDVFRVEQGGAGMATLPKILLLLDNSSSMNANSGLDAACPWYTNTYGVAANQFNTIHLLLATLIGCESADDGLIDAYAGLIAFSARTTSDPPNNSQLPADVIATQTGGGYLVSDWTTDANTLETRIMLREKSVNGRLEFQANVPLTDSLKQTGLWLNSTLTDGNYASSCGADGIIFIGDGGINGNAKNFEWACDNYDENVAGNEPWFGARYLANHDVLCNVTGTQEITTHVLGISLQNGTVRQDYQNIADYGDGNFYEASDIATIRSKLEAVFAAVASRASVMYASVSIQRDQNYLAGNSAFVSSFSPQAQGTFWGNLKRMCVLPTYDALADTYDTVNKTCLFKSDDGQTLLTNPNALDLWTGTQSTDTDVGGAGSLLRARLGNSSGVPSAPVRPRTIVTWEQWDWQWRPVDLAFTDWWAWYQGWNVWMPPSDNGGIINRIHGYTWASDATGNPVEVQEWPLADTIHPDLALLTYGDCDAAGECFILASTNAGLVSIFDAADGREVSAILPQELLNPYYNYAHKSRLRAIEDQPSADGLHRYFVDGGMAVFHLDDDGDTYIDATETARLIFGLGRGGRAYYMMPVTTFNGTPSTANNPIYPLTRQPEGAFRELQETWATPWTARVVVDDTATRRNVAVFPTGHVQAYDWPDAPMPSELPGPETYAWLWKTCADFAADLGLDANATCNHVDASNPTGGYADAGVPVDIGPFSYPNAIAYRFGFKEGYPTSHFNVDPNDTLLPIDSQGRASAAWTGTGSVQAGYPWSPTFDWERYGTYVFDSSASLRWQMNGQATAHDGFVIDSVNVITRTEGAVGPHSPGVYIVDLSIWNGWSNSGPTAYWHSSAQDDSVLAFITRQCPSGAYAVAGCVDQATSPDLANMTCPISGDVAIDPQGDKIRAMYFGDECGQIWKAYYDDDNDRWAGKRILSLNDEQNLSNQAVPRGKSKDFRKIFRKIAVVPSTCPGANVTGLYFGTGNVQRPNASDLLGDVTLTDGHDVVGVVWDDDSDDIHNLTLDNLKDATSIASITPESLAALDKYGWYIALADDEKMLRDPRVVLGTAYFKTHTQQAGAAEVCGNTPGIDRVYAMNNCTAAPIADMNGDGDTNDVEDRAVWTGSQDIGGDIQVITTKDGVMVTAMDLTTANAAALRQRTTRANAQLFLWRLEDM